MTRFLAAFVLAAALIVLGPASAQQFSGQGQGYGQRRQFQQGQFQQQQGVDEQCLKCLCEGSTRNCNRNAGCDRDGFCGPFLISRRYWEEAGSLENDFERCTKDYDCAQRTVRAYMQKYGKDCDGDGDTDCMDFALIHHKGVGGCPYSDFAQDSLYRYVKDCLRRHQQPGAMDKARSFGQDVKEKAQGAKEQVKDAFMGRSGDQDQQQQPLRGDEAQRRAMKDRERDLSSGPSSSSSFGGSGGQQQQDTKDSRSKVNVQQEDRPLTKPHVAEQDQQKARVQI